MSLIKAGGRTRPLFVTAGLLSLVALLNFCARIAHPPITSPSGEYRIFATIEEVSLIKLHLTNKEGVELHAVNSGASDAMKWALGWMPGENVVVLQSSDIGTRAYDIVDNRLVAKPGAFENKRIQARAKILKAQKYGNSYEMDVTIKYEADGKIMDSCDNDDPKAECSTRPAQPN